jgi:type I restriction enzyme S subunit
VISLADKLPNGWAMATVARVGSVRLGRQVSPRHRTGLYPTKYLRLANLVPRGLDLTDVQEMDFTPDEREIYALQPGDIILADSSGSKEHVGRAAIWQGQIPVCCYQNHLIRFRPHAVDSQFALLAFRHMASSGVFAQVARGVGIQHLGLSRFANLPFALPPIAEQRRIASAYLEREIHLQETRDALLSALSSIDAQNKEILAAAISGDLVGRIGKNGSGHSTSRQWQLSRRSAQPSLFGDGVDSTLPDSGALPSGWTYVSVEEAGEVLIGKQLSREATPGSQSCDYLRVANVMDNNIDVSDIKQMYFSRDELKTYKLLHGDILLTEGGSVTGRPAMYQGQPRNVCFQNSLIRFRASAITNPEYALLVFRHYFYSGLFQQASRGVGIQHLSLRRFIAIPFPLPPMDVQIAIVESANLRLAASAAQERVIRDSLEKLPSMERELLEAALSGLLTTQDGRDQNALELLAEFGLPLKSAEPKKKRTNPVSRSRKPTLPATPVANLASVLSGAEKPLTVSELFIRAGYSRDSVEHVEQFYIALRSAIGHSIRIVGSANENATLGVADDAP